MWSGSGKTLCLWSADTGAWLGKIGHDRDLEEPPPPVPNVMPSYDSAESLSSFSGETGAHIRISSSKVTSNVGARQ